jgi:hypothetical protein
MMELGEPADPRWRAARRVVLDHLLALSVWAPGGDQLVLRGSMPMTGWYLRQARSPGDLDWLVLGASSGPDESMALYGSLRDLARDLPEERLRAPEDDTLSGVLGVGGEHLRPAGFRAEHQHRWERATEHNPPPWLGEAEPAEPETGCPPQEGLLEMVRTFPVVAGPTGEIRLDPDRAAVTGVWEYDTGGMRLTIPWRAAGLPDGTARCDFAQPDASERNPVSGPLGEPVLTAVPRGDGGWPTTVHTVDRGLALAWKLQWLHTDNHPEDGDWYDEEDDTRERVAQGKDLYDAVLLAEDPATELEPARLRAVFEPAWQATTGGPAGIAEWVRGWQVDWDGFRAAHPELTGTVDEWLTRLAGALSRHWWPGRARQNR